MRNNLTNILYRVFISSLLILTFSCRNVNENIKEEISFIQKNCPKNMGDGAMLTNVELLENEKIIEYHITMSDMENLESFDDKTLKSLKIETIKEINELNENSNNEIISIKNILEEKEYIVRYIFSNNKNVELGRFEISKNNL